MGQYFDQTARVVEQSKGVYPYVRPRSRSRPRSRPRPQLVQYCSSYTYPLMRLRSRSQRTEACFHFAARLGIE